MKLRLLMLPALAGLLFAGTALAACGGDDDDDNGGSEATNTPRPDDEDDNEATNTPEGEDDDPTATPEGDDDDNGGGGELTGSGADDLRDLAQDLSNKTFSVTYEFEGDDELGISTMTLIQAPPKTATKIESAEGSLAIIYDGEQTFLCTDDGTESGCFTTPGGADDMGFGELFSLGGLLTELDSDISVNRIDNRRIAGRNARCFEIQQDGQDGVACFDERDGIMLFAEGESDGQVFRLEATDVSTNVPDSAFEPPYEVTSLTGD